MGKTVKSKTAYGIRLLFLLTMLSGPLNLAGKTNGTFTASTVAASTAVSGDTFQNPINAGTFSSAFSGSHTVNTTDFTNTFGRATNEVFYKMTLLTPMNVVITNCGSALSDTYLYLLDANGNTIDYNDDYGGTGACSSAYHSVIKKTLQAGTYYAVSEGYSSNGSITTNVSATPDANSIIGNTRQNPIVAGTYSSPFNYSGSQNTVNFTNTYGQSSNDVFYKFMLSVPMTVIVSHCGSALSDTYLHLLDANGNRIAYNDDYNGTCSNYYHSYLKQDLAEGTYYVVSEGYSVNGVIATSITGEIAFTYSYDASGNRTSRRLYNSAIAGLRSAGNATDPGRDGSKDEIKSVEGGGGLVAEELLQFIVNIYPNPTDGLVTINIPACRNGEIRIFDPSGKNLYNRKITGETEIIDLSSYVPGTYMAEISVDGKMGTYKIIKNRK
ncbi:MAG: T9SS type A sorting domain-containing protein [Dysgonamonadaceae bacterium]|jgi:YD repeat-containing protein|nr:T9SS type A sorting domain-containing protein [Dysgonamonadaceae bacterium]